MSADVRVPNAAGRRGTYAPTTGPSSPRALAEWCESGLTETAYIDPGAPWQNAWVESFNARLRDELLDVEEFSTLAEARSSRSWASRSATAARSSPPTQRNEYNANHHRSRMASWRRAGTNRTLIPELSHRVDR